MSCYKGGYKQIQKLEVLVFSILMVNALSHRGHLYFPLVTGSFPDCKQLSQISKTVPYYGMNS